MPLRSMLASIRIGAFGVLVSGALGACSSDPGGAASGAATSGASGMMAQPLAGAGGAAAGTAGAPAAGAVASGGSLPCADCTTQGGANSAGAGGRSADAGSDSVGGASAGGVAGAGASPGQSGGSSGGPPSNCGLPTPVSFQKNIQGFLTTSCGKAVSGGCHVTDTAKTSLGYDHAYDWITAIAHTSSCGKTQPYVKRFEVVLAVIAGPKPASCPNSRQMPPPGMGTALTTCQVAALQAWLAEPMVSQTHVPETDDTKDLYPPGPYLMPPFN